MDKVPRSAFDLLRQTWALLSSLPADWVPSPAETRALREAAELLQQVIARAADPQATDQPSRRRRRRRRGPPGPGPEQPGRSTPAR